MRTLSLCLMKDSVEQISNVSLVSEHVFCALTQSHVAGVWVHRRLHDQLIMRRHLMGYFLIRRWALLSADGSGHRPTPHAIKNQQSANTPMTPTRSSLSRIAPCLVLTSGISFLFYIYPSPFAPATHILFNKCNDALNANIFNYSIHLPFNLSIPFTLPHTFWSNHPEHNQQDRFGSRVLVDIPVPFTLNRSDTA